MRVQSSELRAVDLLLLHGDSHGSRNSGAVHRSSLILPPTWTNQVVLGGSCSIWLHDWAPSFNEQVPQRARNPLQIRIEWFAEELCGDSRIGAPRMILSLG